MDYYGTQLYGRAQAYANSIGTGVNKVLLSFAQLPDSVGLLGLLLLFLSQYIQWHSLAK